MVTLEAINKNFYDAFSKVKDDIEHLQNGADSFDKDLSKIKSEYSDADNGLYNELNQRIKSIKDDIKGYNKHVSNIKKDIGKKYSTFDKRLEDLEKVSKSIEKANKDIRRLNEFLENLEDFVALKQDVLETHKLVDMELKQLKEELKHHDELHIQNKTAFSKEATEINSKMIKLHKEIKLDNDNTNGEFSSRLNKAQKEQKEDINLLNSSVNERITHLQKELKNSDNNLGIALTARINYLQKILNENSSQLKKHEQKLNVFSHEYVFLSDFNDRATNENHELSVLRNKLKLNEKNDKVTKRTLRRTKTSLRLLREDVERKLYKKDFKKRMDVLIKRRLIKCVKNLKADTNYEREQKRRLLKAVKGKEKDLLTKSAEYLEAKR